jgi:enamine deaminase RidA (YjgF/YER057c/UK114 family)
MITQDPGKTSASPIPSPPRARRNIYRQHNAALDLVIFDQPRTRELHLTLRPQAGESAPALVQRLTSLLKEHDARIVKQDIFGSLAVRGGALDGLRHALGEIQWPITWLEGADCAGNTIAGIQVLAVSGAPVETITLNGRIIGRAFDDGDARHCLLAEIGPKASSGAPADQTRQTYETLEAALQQAGMNVTQVVRTWFFLDDILTWYDPFNGVRNAFFAKHKLSPGSLPASTGVSARNLAGAALTLSAWAIRPHADSVRVKAIPSPLQCPAPEYGSGFSRAVEVSTPHGRRLFVSGTASIAPDGHSACIGDVQAQIALTMDVVKAILDARSLTLSEVTRAIAYFKHASDTPAFANWFTAHGVALMPHIAVKSDICRPELLFELELDALA